MNKKVFVATLAVASLFVLGIASPVFAHGQQQTSGSSTKPLTLTYMDYWGQNPAHAAITAYIAKFEKANPNIKISRTSVPFGQLLPKALQEAASHSLPNVLMLDNPMLQDFASTGALAPLDKFTTLDKSKYFSGPLSTVTYKGKVYGLPVGNNNVAIFYNKKMFKAANLTPPKTWSQLITDAKKLTHGNTYGIAFSMPTNETATWQYEPFLWTNGGHLRKVNTPQAIAALKVFTKLLSDGSASQSVVNWSQNDVEKQFQLGHAAMMENGPWNIPLLTKAGMKYGTDYGIVPIPVPHAGMKPVPPLGGEVYTIPTGKTNIEKAAWKYVRMLKVPADVIAVDKAMGYIPAYIPAAKQLVSQEPVMSVFMQQLRTGRARTEYLGTNYPKVSQVVWNAIQSALVGTSTPKQALDQAQKQIKTLLSQS